LPKINILLHRAYWLSMKDVRSCCYAISNDFRTRRRFFECERLNYLLQKKKLKSIFRVFWFIRTDKGDWKS